MTVRISPVSCSSSRIFRCAVEPVLQAIRAAKLPPVALKAVLTDENKGWNVLELREELQKEHEALH